MGLSKAQVLYIHAAAIKRHGGSFGLRDEGLLESALARAENYYAYGEVDLFLLAAAYAEGIARNHPFIDGNKRTAYTAAGLFLYAHGYHLIISSVPAQIAFFERVAIGQVSLEELAEFYDPFGVKPTTEVESFTPTKRGPVGTQRAPRHLPIG